MSHRKKYFFFIGTSLEHEREKNGTRMEQDTVETIFFLTSSSFGFLPPKAPPLLPFGAVENKGLTPLKKIQNVKK